MPFNSNNGGGGGPWGGGNRGGGRNPWGGGPGRGGPGGGGGGGGQGPDLDELLKVDTAGWQHEIHSVEQHFAQFGDKLPQGLADELTELKRRLGA